MPDDDKYEDLAESFDAFAEVIENVGERVRAHDYRASATLLRRAHRGIGRGENKETCLRLLKGGKDGGQRMLRLHSAVPVEILRAVVAQHLPAVFTTPE